MKIYNKKGFISGVVSLSICLFGLVTMVVKGFSIKSAVLFTILSLFGMTEIGKSFSKKATQEDVLAETDERNKYIDLKTAHKSLQILHLINYAATIVLMITYAMTKNNIVLGAFILSGLYITVSFVVSLATNIYYEKHE